MAGGTKRPKRAKPRARTPAPPRRPVLGNDPFERGAAPRAPAAAEGASSEARPRAAETAVEPPPIATPAPRPAPTPTSSPISSAAPTRGPVETSPLADVAGAAAARLASVEQRVDAALDGAETRLEELARRSGIASLEEELREALARLLPAVRARLAAALDVVRLLEPPERLDRFGMDARFAERLEPLVDLLYTSWWRVAVRDVERVPAAGPAIVVANHAGVVPWDALVLRHALRRDHPARRELRPLLDDRECALPIFGGAAIRAGAVRASADAAARLLAAGDLVGVFPEGSAAARKPWRDRYRLQRFGRGGFAKVALRARAPIVPCAILGSEEAQPGIARTGWLAERLGVPLLAANPSLRFGAAALLPLPSRWTIRFGEPVDVRAHAADAADDPGVVNALAERVRAAVQGMLDEGLAARSSVFL